MGDLNKRFPRYSKLLRLYPRGYRQEYSEQMLQTLADMLDDPHHSKTAVWLRTALDLPFSALYQQLSYTGGVMSHETPTYVKRNALIGAALLVPFGLALLANGLDKIINDRTLYHSWLWQMPLLAIWVLWLPLAAVVIALPSFVIYLARRAKHEHTSWFKQLFDIHHNWPLLLVSLCGLFILALVFGHDSVHCVTRNPVRELRNAHQTWQCIQRGSL